LDKAAHGLRFGGEGQRMQFNQHTTSQLGGIMISQAWRIS